MKVLDTNDGDTVVIKFPNGMSGSENRHYVENITEMFKGQGVRLLFLPQGTSLDLIKSSNLIDNTDIEEREKSPALQDAWEQYQAIKQLTKDNNE